MWTEFSLCEKIGSNLGRHSQNKKNPNWVLFYTPPVSDTIIAHFSTLIKTKRNGEVTEKIIQNALSIFCFEKMAESTFIDRENGIVTISPKSETKQIQNPASAKMRQYSVSQKKW